MDMPQIRLNRQYNKLAGAQFARLLDVRIVSKTGLSKELIEYDTDNQYELPDGMLIMLLFSPHRTHLFTTFRRYSMEKYNKYTSQVGKKFRVVIEH